MDFVPERELARVAALDSLHPDSPVSIEYCLTCIGIQTKMQQKAANSEVSGQDDGRDGAGLARA